MHRPVSWLRQRLAVTARLVTELEPKSDRCDSTRAPRAKRSDSAAQRRLSQAVLGSKGSESGEWQGTRFGRRVFGR